MLVIDNAVDFCELNSSELALVTHLYLPFNYLNVLFYDNSRKQKFLDNLKKCNNLQSLNINNNNLDAPSINEVYSYVPSLKKTHTPFYLPDNWYLSEKLSQEELLEIIDIAEHKNKQNPYINNFDECSSDSSEEYTPNSNFPVPVAVVEHKAYIIAEYDTIKTINLDEKIKPAVCKYIKDSKTCLINTWLKRNVNNHAEEEFIACDEDVSVAKKLRIF